MLKKLSGNVSSTALLQAFYRRSAKDVPPENILGHRLQSPGGRQSLREFYRRSAKGFINGNSPQPHMAEVGFRIQNMKI